MLYITPQNLLVLQLEVGTFDHLHLFPPPITKANIW